MAPLTQLLLWSTAILGAYAQPRVPQELYQERFGVEPENLALRPNAFGRLLVTSIGTNIISDVNTGPRGSVSDIASIPGKTSLLGIGEISPEIFAVVAGNLSRAAGPTAGSFSVWAVNVAAIPAIVTEVACIPSASLLNGLTVLPPRRNSPRNTNGTVLVSDTIKGVIYHVDPTTGQVATVKAPKALLAAGLNGIRYQPALSTFFAANSIAKTLSASLLAITYSPSRALPNLIFSPPRVIASNLAIDDFTVLPDGTSYVAAGATNSVVKVNLLGQRSDVVAGNNTGAGFTGPTSTAFGTSDADRATKRLYVSTNGNGLGEGLKQPGKVFYVDLA